MPDLSEISPLTGPHPRRGQGRREDRDADRLRRAVGARCSMRRASTSCSSATRSRWRSTASRTRSRPRWTRWSATPARSRAPSSAPSSSATCRFSPTRPNPRRAVANAGRFLAEGGCAAVKVEGGRRVLPAVEAILAADIPVMGHVGLTPQSYRKLGGFKVQGREADSRARDPRRTRRRWPTRDASRSCSSACRRRWPPRSRGRSPCRRIGIGAGPHCDGQVLVFHDVMGLTRDLRPQVRPALRGPLARHRRRRPRLREGRQERQPSRRRGVLHGRQGRKACDGCTSKPAAVAGGQPGTPADDFALMVTLTALARCAPPCDERAQPASRRLRADDGRAPRGPPLSRRGSRGVTRLSSSCRSSSTRSSSRPDRGFRPLPAARGGGRAACSRAEGVDVALPAAVAGTCTPRDFSTRVEVAGVSEGGEGARASRALPRRRDGRHEALPPGRARRRRLRPQRISSRSRSCGGCSAISTFRSASSSERPCASRTGSRCRRATPISRPRSAAARAISRGRSSRRGRAHAAASGTRGRSRPTRCDSSRRRASPSSTSTPSTPRRWRRAPEVRPGSRPRGRGPPREDAADRQRFPA